MSLRGDRGSGATASARQGSLTSLALKRRLRINCRRMIGLIRGSGTCYLSLCIPTKRAMIGALEYVGTRMFSGKASLVLTWFYSYVKSGEYSVGGLLGQYCTQSWIPQLTSFVSCASERGIVHLYGPLRFLSHVHWMLPFVAVLYLPPGDSTIRPIVAPVRPEKPSSMVYFLNLTNLNHHILRLYTVSLQVIPYSAKRKT
jgi:hypothetical protein